MILKHQRFLYEEVNIQRIEYIYGVDLFSVVMRIFIMLCKLLLKEFEMINNPYGTERHVNDQETWENGSRYDGPLRSTVQRSDMGKNDSLSHDGFGVTGNDQL